MRPVMHFPCDETSGDIVTCNVSGSVLADTVSGLRTYGTPYAVTFKSPSTQTFLINNFEKYSQGRIVFYFSGITDDTIPSPGNNKCSISHNSYPYNTRCDIQRNAEVDQTGVFIQHVHESGKGAPQNSAYAQINLTDAASFNQYNSGSFAGCVSIPFNSQELPVMYRSDGVTTRVDTLAHTFGGTNYAKYGRYEWALPYSDLSDTAVTEGFTPGVYHPDPLIMIFKGTTMYCFGVWHFRHHKPSREDYETFVTWLYNQSRLGNKEHYPAWAGYADEPL